MGVTRSQTVHSVDTLFRLGEFAAFFDLPVLLAAYTPVQGEFISAVQGTFNPEPAGVIRGGSLNYVFVPSHLRTKYILSYFTVTLPTTVFAIPHTETGAGEGEWEWELGFLTLVRISGLPYFANPAVSETFKLKATEAKGEEFTVPKRTQQISLVETITAVPGASIELELIPFIRVVSVIKPSKFKSVGFLLLGVPESGTKPITTTAIMVYEQDFEKRG